MPQTKPYWRGVRTMGSSGSCMRMKAARRWGAWGWYRYLQMKKPEPTRKARGNNSTRMTPTAICPPLPVNRSAQPEVALVSYRNYAGDITYHVQLMRSGCSSPGETLCCFLRAERAQYLSRTACGLLEHRHYSQDSSLLHVTASAQRCQYLSGMRMGSRLKQHIHAKVALQGTQGTDTSMQR